MIECHMMAVQADIKAVLFVCLVWIADDRRSDI